VIADTHVAESPTAERILKAAIDEFVAHGLAGARVDRIATRAGVNKQLLYRHFGSKEGLFDAAVRDMLRRFNDIRSALPDTIEDRLPYYFERADSWSGRHCRPAPGRR